MAPHYLDQIPLDFSHPAVKELRSLLYENYFRSAEVIALVRAAGVSPAWINWDQRMVLVWDDVLSTLQKQGRLRRLLQNLIEGPDTALAGRLRELTADQPVTAAPLLAADGIAMPGSAPGDYEKIIVGESTLLDVSFLQRGTDLAPAVVRLLVTLDGHQFFGTAFRIGEDLLLTNHHVLFAASGRGHGRRRMVRVRARIRRPAKGACQRPGTGRDDHRAAGSRLGRDPPGRASPGGRAGHQPDRRRPGRNR